MFGKLYLGEVKKQMRPKAIITLAIFFIIFFIIFAVIYNVDLDNILSGSNITTTNEYGETIEMPIDEYVALLMNQNNVFYDVNSTNIDEKINQARFNIVEAKQYDKENKTNTTYYAKSVLSVLNYLKTNNIEGKDITVEGTSNYLGYNSTEGFVSSYFDTLILILTIYGIVMAAGIFADEYKNGTIKLLMMRPITRSQLTLAKLLGAYTVVLGYLGVMSLIAYAYGAIAFKNLSLKSVFIVFNATSIIKSTTGSVVFLNMFIKVIKLLTLVTASFTIGTLLRKKTTGIIASFVLLFGIVSAIFSTLGIQIFTLSANYDLGAYFTFGGSVMRFGNFYRSCAVLLVYWAIMLVSTFLVVEKRDIA